MGPLCAIFTSFPMTTTLQLFISNDTQFLPIPDDLAQGFVLTAGNHYSAPMIRLELLQDGIEMFLQMKQFNCTAGNKWEDLSVTFGLNFTSDEGEALK